MWVVGQLTVFSEDNSILFMAHSDGWQASIKFIHIRLKKKNTFVISIWRQNRDDNRKIWIEMYEPRPRSDTTP